MFAVLSSNFTLKMGTYSFKSSLCQFWGRLHASAILQDDRIILQLIYGFKMYNIYFVAKLNKDIEKQNKSMCSEPISVSCARQSVHIQVIPNSALPITGINYMTFILNWNNISQYYCLYHISDQINTALGSIRQFFQKPKHLAKLKLLNCRPKRDIFPIL